MRRIIISLMTLVSAALFIGCDRSENGSGHTSWSSSMTPAREITVSSYGREVEKYFFSYDKEKRLDSLKRLDLISSHQLLDLVYRYSGSQVSITGTMGSSKASLDVNDGKKGIDYTGQGWKPWTYHVNISKDGLPSSTEAVINFNSINGTVSSETDYVENYTVQNGDICQCDAGTVIKGDSMTNTKSYSESALTTVYTYLVNEDRQNFAAFLMDCTFPVWYAKGLPGCRHLISDIQVFGGGLDYSSRQHIDYHLDDDGNILEATRTWYAGREEYLQMTYTFSY